MAAGVTWGKNTVFGKANIGAATATPSTGFSFGATNPIPATPTTTSLFGGTNTTNAGSTPAAKSSFSFGSPTAASAPSTSLFGSTTPTSLFGSTTTPSAFGQTPTSTPITQTQTQTHYPYTATPAQAALQAQMHAQQLQEASRIESGLTRLHTAYTSTPPGPTASDQSMPFHHIVYDFLSLSPQSYYPTAAYPPRPTYISPSKWSEALARNPDAKEYQPVSLVGVEPLSTRLSQQQIKADTYKKAMMQLYDTHSTLCLSQEHSKQRMDYYQMQERTIRSKLLQVLKKVEILRCRNIPLQTAERELVRKLSHVAMSLRHTMEELRNVQDLALGYTQTKEMESRRNHGDFVQQQQLQQQRRLLTEDEKRYVSITLEEQRIGLERLVNVVKKDGRDAEIMKVECLSR